MKKLIAITCVSLLGCTDIIGNYHVQPQDDGGTEEAASKMCMKPDAQYQITFNQVSGDCSTTSVSAYDWLDANGKLTLPSGCVDYGTTTSCTTFLDEECFTWSYKEEMSGEMNWDVSGLAAHGFLTFTAFNRQDGSLSCSSVYDTTYTLQWQQADQ